MRASRFLVFASIALAVAGCVHQEAAGVAPGALAPSTQAGARVAGLFSFPGSPAVASDASIPDLPPSVVTAPGAPAPAGPRLMAQDYGRAPMAPLVPLVRPGAAPVAAVIPLGPEGPYRLGAGDKLRITVFGQDGLSNAYLVDASGNVALPLIGSIKAAGLTENQLSAAITERLSNGFIREPHVAVEIEGYRPFFILGEVTAAGQYPFVPNMTAETAVAIAGGFSPRAFHGQVLITRTVNGHPMQIAGPFTIPVRPGDTIMVEERWF